MGQYLEVKILVGWIVALVWVNWTAAVVVVVVYGYFWMICVGGWAGMEWNWCWRLRLLLP